MYCIIIYYLLIVLSSLESVDSSTSVLGTKIKIIKNNNKNKTEMVFIAYHLLQEDHPLSHKANPMLAQA